MRLLHQYLLREFLVPLGFCLCGFLIFWVAFDLFGQMDEFQRAGLKPLDVAQYLLVTSPDILGRVVPVALLLAMLYALTNHARHNELTAMRAAGLSLWNLGIPYFGVSLACGFLLFAVNELLLPDSAEMAEGILNKYTVQSKQGAANQWVKNLSFINASEMRTWQIGAYHMQTYEMLRPHVDWKKPDDSRMELYAERAVYGNGIWNFFQVQQILYPPGALVPSRLTTNYLALPEFTETPRQIKSEIKISAMSSLREMRGASLSLMEILEYQRWHPEARRDHRLNTKFHVRLAAPYTCLIVVLIAIPFGAASGRRNAFVGVASSIFFCFTFFVVQRLGEALGLGGRIDPWLAGWFPNLLFGTLGAILTSRVR
ncbi:MAG: LptF/LptG family permease [Verrucomicrobiota bacterium]